MWHVQCSTIHITPEDGFSYASFEVSCTALHDVETARLVRQVAEIFEPAGAFAFPGPVTTLSSVLSFLIVVYIA